MKGRYLGSPWLPVTQLSADPLDLHPVAWGTVRCHAMREGGPSFERREDGTIWSVAGHPCLAMYRCIGQHSFSDTLWAAEQVTEET